MERSIEWDGTIIVVDQYALPAEFRRISLTTIDELIDAVRRLAIRGAPALGVAGCLGVALSAIHHLHDGRVDEDAVLADAKRLADIRPTAVKLGRGVRRALARLPEGLEAVVDEGRMMLAEDESANRAAARRAADVVRQLCPASQLSLLTHCNTGGLATVAWGTALGAIRELAMAGHVADVFVGETRPLLQGARLTIWELTEAYVPCRLCVDAAGPVAIANGLVDCVLVGADRVARNGDVANKVGTYALACAAARHNVPFVVVAPESSVDPDTPDGASISIEMRPPREVTEFAGRSTTVPGTRVYNPAFDITPHELITAVVTEQRTWNLRSDHVHA
ncbi:MAG TPA: S-methyl-5-thioribose-1-phosphate isomerase [Pseudonocardiaceae bacterium]|nr:S-methyl-5-thioribose-1-phosphate isomerase [Pseudonocardiaceae bacterium]